MSKTLFGKIVTVFIIILLISTSITGTMLYFFLRNSVSQEKEQLLNTSADKINEFFGYYYENRNKPGINSIVKNMFYNILQSYSENTRSIIWIVNTEGYIEIYTDNMPYEATEKLKEDFYTVLKLKDKRQYSEIMTGKYSHVKVIGDFYGLFKETNEQWLTVEKPFIYNGEVISAVYLHTRVPEINRTISSVFKLFVIAVTFSIIISTVLVYIFSLKLSKPIKEINDAAKQIANGQFDKRLDIVSEDEIGELVKSFNNMAGALQKLEEMRRGFIANVSHELRTPMTSIHGFVEGILDGTIPYEKQNVYLSIVKEEVLRLNRLTNDLLDLAKMEAGEVKMSFITFNINELIRRCIIKLENQIVEKKINIEAKFEEIETYVNADLDSIERVLINLTHNAIKFVQEDGNIIISTSRMKNRVLISIEDDGVGIDSTELDLIWDRFYKSDKSRSKEKGGTGLGLAIVKNIINEHKQSIWVTSEIGKGTKFYFTLANGEKSKEGYTGSSRM